MVLSLVGNLLVLHHFPWEMAHLRQRAEAGGPRQVDQIHIAVEGHAHPRDVVVLERQHDVGLASVLHGHRQVEAGEPREEIYARTSVHDIGRLARTVAGKIKTCTKNLYLAFVGVFVRAVFLSGLDPLLVESLGWFSIAFLVLVKCRGKLVLISRILPLTSQIIGWNS